MNNTKNIDTLVNGERTFEVHWDIKNDSGYVLVKDIDHKNTNGFYLPENVIKGFKPQGYGVDFVKDQNIKYYLFKDVQPIGLDEGSMEDRFLAALKDNSLTTLAMTGGTYEVISSLVERERIDGSTHSLHYHAVNTNNNYYPFLYESKPHPSKDGLKVIQLVFEKDTPPDYIEKVIDIAKIVNFHSKLKNEVSYTILDNALSLNSIEDVNLEILVNYDYNSFVQELLNINVDEEHISIKPRIKVIENNTIKTVINNEDFAYIESIVNVAINSTCVHSIEVLEDTLNGIKKYNNTLLKVLLDIEAKKIEREELKKEKN